MSIQLFYTERCVACTDLLQTILNKNMTTMITLVCLDDLTSKQIVALNIRQVPTIIVTKVDQTTVTYEGPQDCSQWINTVPTVVVNEVTHVVSEENQVVQEEHRVAQDKHRVAQEKYRVVISEDLFTNVILD